MNNIISVLEIEEINSQIRQAFLKKNKLIKDIFKEYEYYLELLRELLSPSVEKGVRVIYLDSFNKSIIQNNNDLVEFLNKKASHIISKKIPFITIEQLIIPEITSIKNQNINLDRSLKSTELKHYETNKSDLDENFISSKQLQLKLDDDISDISYYPEINSEKIFSIDLDNIDDHNYYQDFESIEKIGLEKQFFISLLELMRQEDSLNSKDFDKLNNYTSNDNYKYQNLDCFNLLEKTLSELLLNLSYEINSELFDSNIIKSLISRDSFKFLANKKFFLRHPHPFVINFDLNIADSTIAVGKIPNPFLFNISVVELEFKNLDLSIQRNKINDLKKKFQLLIKKERYWRQKEINLNKINRKL